MAPIAPESKDTVLEDIVRSVETLQVQKPLPSVPQGQDGKERDLVLEAERLVPSSKQTGHYSVNQFVTAKEYEEVRARELQTARFPHYLPVYTAEPSGEPIPYDHIDPGLRASPTYANLFPPTSTHTLSDLTPSIGSEVRGLDLLTLTPPQKDDLALLIAQRKVVVFPNQRFHTSPIPAIIAFGAHFGQLSIHPMAPHAVGHPEILSVARAEGDDRALKALQGKTNLVNWHSDISYERQTPGTTFLWLLEGPTENGRAGGDTLFASGVEAYRRLSPEFRKRLHGLKAVHSSDMLIATAKALGTPNRRPVLNTIHPVVRVHPVTGEKSLFVNRGFTRYIVGLKQEESDLLLNFLYTHIALGQDFQARVKWQEGTVVAWDNRVTNHTAIVDWHRGERRLLGRLTPLAGVVVEGVWDEKEAGEF